MKTWTIVKFTKENTVDAVPTSWLFGDTKCYWPPETFSKEKINKTIRKNDEGPNTCWPLFDIKIVGNSNYDDYLKARSKAIRAEDTSDINTDLDKKQRRYRSAKQMSSSSSESDSELLEVIPSPPVINKKGSTKENMNNKFNKNRTLHENSNDGAALQIEKNPPAHQVTDDKKCTCCPMHRNDAHNIRQILLQQSLLKEIISAMADDLQKIALNKRQDLELDAVNGHDLMKKFDFPLKTIEELENTFEKYLENEENYKLAVYDISRLGGKDITEFLKRTLNLLMSNALAVQYSWFGKKSNRPFCNLQLPRMLIDAAKVLDTKVTNKLCETFMMNWLRRAKERLERQK